MKVETLLILGAVAVGGYLIYRAVSAPKTSQVNPAPNQPTTAAGSIWDNLSALTKQSSAGMQAGATDAQQAASVIGALGQFASGLGSAIRAGSEAWGTGGSQDI